ncbi:MAG: phage tail tape measure protein [Candidatus Bathyarchaeia archaeon]
MSFEVGRAVITIEAIDLTRNVIGSLQANLGQLSGLVSQLGGGFKSLGSVIGGFASGGVAGAAIAATSELIQGLQDSVEAAASFEQALNRIAAVTGASTEDIHAFRSAIEQVAPEFGRSLEEVSGALEALAKAGVDIRDSAGAMEALRGVLQMAAIEGANATEMANALAQAMAMFGLSAADSEKAVDALVNASKEGIGTVQDFAVGLGYVGSTAASMGLSIDETLAAVVKLERQLGSAEKAGRYLDAMFRSLIKNGEEAGIQIFDASGQMKSMAEIVQELERWLGQFDTEAERSAAIMEVFDSQGARAVQMLVSMDEAGRRGSEVIADLAAKLGESGSAAEMAAKQMEGYTATQARFNAAMQVLQVQVGEALLPALTDFMQYLLELGEAVGPAFGEIQEALAELGRALGLSSEDLQKLGDIIKNFIVIELKGLAQIIRWVAQGVEGLKAAGAGLYEALSKPFGIAIAIMNAFLQGIQKVAGAWDWLWGKLTGKQPQPQTPQEIFKLEMPELPREVQETGGAMAAATTPIFDYRSSMEQLWQTMDRTKTVHQETNATLEEQAEVLGEVGEVAKGYEQVSNMTVEDLKAMNQEYATLVESRDAVVETITKFNEGFQQVRQNLQGAASAAQQLLTSINALPAEKHVWIYIHQVYGGGGGEATTTTAGAHGAEGYGRPVRREVWQRMQAGGWIPETGLYLLHRGEYVVPAHRAEQPIGTANMNVHNTFYVNASNRFEVDQFLDRFEERMVEAWRRIRQLA